MSLISLVRWKANRNTKFGSPLGFFPLFFLLCKNLPQNIQILIMFSCHIVPVLETRVLILNKLPWECYRLIGEIWKKAGVWFLLMSVNTEHEAVALNWSKFKIDFKTKNNPKRTDIKDSKSWSLSRKLWCLYHWRSSRPNTILSVGLTMDRRMS